MDYTNLKSYLNAELSREVLAGLTKTEDFGKTVSVSS